MLQAYHGLTQHPFYRMINDDTGLPTNEIYRIIQDGKGYLWIGCDAGLYRYDGVNFKPYRNIHQNSRSISNLSLDDDGRVWCSNFTGQIFYALHDSLHVVTEINEKANRFQPFFIHHPGFYLLDETGFSWYDKNGKRIKHWKYLLQNSKYLNSSSAWANQKEAWIEIPALGLLYAEAGKDSLQFILPASSATGYLSQRLFLYQNSLFLFRSEYPPSTQNFLYKIDLQRKTVQLLMQFHQPVVTRYYFFTEDSQKNLWIGTSNGAICLKNIFDFDSPATTFFKNKNISSVYEDTEKNLWFTSLQQGIFMIPHQPAEMLIDEKQSDPIADITAMQYLSDNQMLIGYYNGGIKSYNTKKNEFIPVQAINQHQGLAIKDIECYKNRWYVSRGALVVYDPVNNQTIIPSGYGNARDLALVNDTLYALHADCLLRFPIQSIQNNQHPLIDTLLLTGGRKMMIEKETSIIYAGLNNGLVAIKNGKISPLYLHNTPVYVNTFAANQSYVFAGTQSQGILVLKQGKIVSQWLPRFVKNDITPKAMAANANYLWICSYTDLIRVNLTNLQINKYSRSIGINPKDVNCMLVMNDTMYIGTKKMFLRIDASYNPENFSIPNVFFTSVKIDNSPVHDTELELPYYTNTIQFEFRAFSYRSDKDFVYEYRLLGADSEWKSLNYAIPSVTYNSLPPGSYTFQVRAVNESGFSDQPASYAFVVGSPPWQTWWFYLMISMVSVLIIYLVFRARLRAIEKKSIIEKKLIASQLSALKAQMNPHFMYNSLNSIQALILKQDFRSTNKYLSKFSTLMRKVLDASGQEYITLTDETEILIYYLDLEKLRFGEDFTYSVHVDQNIIPDQCLVPSMIIQPFVENAIKHGLLHKVGPKHVSIDFKVYDHKILCTITDNGVGRKISHEINKRREKAHKSFATDAVTKRIDLLNEYTEGKYQIEIVDLMDGDQPAGTCVKIYLPQSALGN